MLESAQPVKNFNKSKLLFSHKTKIIFVTVILFASFISGKITFLNDPGKSELAFQETQRNISSIASAQSVNKKVYTQGYVSDARIGQFTQIAIGKKLSTRINPTPIKTKTKSFGNIWGMATKIDTHTYTMQVQADNSMATPQEILTALNNYRTQHGRGQLIWDDALASFANKRAEYFSQKTTLDKHEGFLNYLNNQDGFKNLGFTSLGENSSIGFTLSAVHLIEWVYAGDEEHDSNQLNIAWDYVGIGVSRNATDLVFAGNKM